MPHSVAIVGAGVSGLSCAVLLAERGHRTEIFAREVGRSTTSGAAGAIWYPYDAEPADKVIPWALATYQVLLEFCAEPGSGVSMIELRTFSRVGEIAIPKWAHALGARLLSVGTGPSPISSYKFRSGFAFKVPLMDTTIYLDYLASRFLTAAGEITGNIHLDRLEDVDRKFDLVINCSGIGARGLAHDAELEPHRGQVVIVPKFDLSCAVVCDDDPLMYAIPRTNDCLFGGTNEVSDNQAVDPATTAAIVAECSRVLDIDQPKVTAERVGLRPFRRSGVCLRSDQLRDGRTVIHNYGHGGSGFTLSWGCAENVLELAG